MQTKNFLAILSAIFVVSAAQAASSITYSNATTYSGSFLNPDFAQVGDEINLGPGARYAESFRFEYYGLNFDNNETVRLIFYANDGDGIGNGVFKPDSVLYDSGVNSLPAPDNVDHRNTLQYDLTFDVISLPDRFTFAVIFGGIEGDDVVGLPLYDPPTIGYSENDYWYNDGSGWQLRATNGVPINFGASLVTTTVPEPSTYMLALLGGLCGFVLVSRRKRRAN